jgi:ribosomal protein S18 acetylase RimI-like enzyme
MNITTRPATTSDKPLARRLHHLAYRDVVERQFGEWDELVQDGFFDDGWALADYDIVLLDGEPCGYAAIVDHEDHMQVLELVVHPEHQGKGIGSALLQDAINRADLSGLPVRLAVLRENRAIRLYERFGFREMQRTDTHVGMEGPITRGSTATPHARQP